MVNRMKNRILAINTGSTSTKFSVYEDGKPLFVKNISHDSDVLNGFKNLEEEVEYRKNVIENTLKEMDFDMKTIDIVMCRGGIIMHPKISTGGYEVNDDLYEALGRGDITQNHASQQSGLIGKRIADSIGKKAYIYDAVTAGDLIDVAQITGFKDVRRISMCHVLNTRAMALKYAKEVEIPFENLNLVVAHIGGGCSIAVFSSGRIIESTGDDDGPFSPERSGSIPALQLIDLCFSNNYSKEEIIKKVRGRGGLYALLGTSDVRAVKEKIKAGDSHAELVFHAMAYQISKGIALNSVALKGQTDAIILTGGAAYSKLLTDKIREYVRFIAPVIVMPGENEIEALAQGGARILSGEEKAKEYVWPAGFERKSRTSLEAAQ